MERVTQIVGGVRVFDPQTRSSGRRDRHKPAGGGFFHMITGRKATWNEKDPEYIGSEDGK